MRLDARETGEALAAAAGELTRIWRGACADAHAAAFPALLDGAVEPFVAEVAAALVAGRPAEDAWERTAGVVRLDRASVGRAEVELAAEWRLLAEVLAAACDALEADPGAADAVARAVDAGRRGSVALRGGAGPAGVLIVFLLGGFRPRVASRP
jgi:hypothetical protein